MLRTFPAELIIMIFKYVADEHNDIMLPQYDINSNHLYYKINWKADPLWNLRALIWTKYVYPIYTAHSNPAASNNRHLYAAHKSYTENKLRHGIEL